MSDKDTIRDMVMALSRGDHETATAASSEVITSKTASIAERLGENTPQKEQDSE